MDMTEQSVLEKIKGGIYITKHNLFKSYLTYDWMLQGLNAVSSGVGSAGSASTG
ncbi:MAG: hypothetical protein WA113_09345 [Desulfitobacteriaceae bacterium]